MLTQDIKFELVWPPVVVTRAGTRSLLDLATVERAFSIAVYRMDICVFMCLICHSCNRLT